MEKLYTVREVAEIFGLNEQTIYRWIKKGKLQASRLGRSVRIKQSTVEEIVDVGCEDTKLSSGEPIRQTQSRRITRKGRPLWEI